VQRVTLDSSQYISALNFGGLPLRVLNLAVAGEIEIVISEPIIAEVLRVLSNKFAWPQARLAQVEGTMRKLGEVVTPVEQLQVLVSDPDDDRILEAAVAGKCQAIVTGEKALLRLRNFRGIAILTARELLQQARAK